MLRSRLDPGRHTINAHHRGRRCAAAASPSTLRAKLQPPAGSPMSASSAERSDGLRLNWLSEEPTVEGRPISLTDAGVAYRDCATFQQRITDQDPVVPASAVLFQSSPCGPALANSFGVVWHFAPRGDQHNPCRLCKRRQGQSERRLCGFSVTPRRGFHPGNYGRNAGFKRKSHAEQIVQRVLPPSSAAHPRRRSLRPSG